jgi:hypothetical protein
MDLTDLWGIILFYTPATIQYKDYHMKSCIFAEVAGLYITVFSRCIAEGS